MTLVRVCGTVPELCGMVPELCGIAINSRSDCLVLVRLYACVCGMAPELCTSIS